MTSFRQAVTHVGLPHVVISPILLLLAVMIVVTISSTMLAAAIPTLCTTVVIIVDFGVFRIVARVVMPASTFVLLLVVSILCIRLYLHVSK